MAGSRLDRIGTLFSRASGLLRSGAVKYQDRPVWYDVYRVFPPKYEPRFDREPERTSEIPEILYNEDKPRADFFKRFGMNPSGEVRHLTDLASEEISQAFVRRYQEVEKSNPNWSPDQVFEAAADAYQATRPAYSTRRDISTTSSTSRGESSQSHSFRDRSGGQDSQESQEYIERPATINRERRTPIITAESLRSLFEEAKEKQTLEKESKTEGSSPESTKPKDSNKS